MKLRHLPVVIAHDPGFVAQYGLRMLRHTFRGTTLRTWLGLESERDAFRRYKRIRQAEREYVPAAIAPGGGRVRATPPAGDPSPAQGRT